MTPPACWFLAPRACPAATGPIQLGNIVSAPATPIPRTRNRHVLIPLQVRSVDRVDEPLYTAPAARPPTATPLHAFHERNFTLRHRAPAAHRAGVFAAFLQHVVGAGADVGVAWASETESAVAARRVATRWFEPSGAEVRAVVEGEGAVRDYIAGSWFRNKVYMVMGVMVAEGGARADRREVVRGVDASVGVDATVPFGVPVGGGPRVQVRRASEVRVGSEEAEEGFVFAFRLREIRVRRGGEVAARNLRKGALFDGTAASAAYGDEEGEKRNMTVELEELVDEDATGEDFGMEALDSLEEGTDEECVCVPPE